MQSRQIIETQLVPAARLHDTLDRFSSHARDAQEQFARGFVQVDRKEMSVAQCPRKLRIDREIEIRCGRSCQLASIEAVKANQPVSLVKPVLTDERRRD